MRIGGLNVGDEIHLEDFVHGFGVRSFDSCAS
jgi:hypothetical protein